MVEIIISRIQAAFPQLEFETGKPPDPILQLKAKDQSVGGLFIYYDGEEATVEIENITHGHFNPYDARLTQMERIDIITQDVIEFMQELFNDQVLLWKRPSGIMGGWKRLNVMQEKPKLSSKNEYFVWSGAYHP